MIPMPMATLISGYTIFKDDSALVLTKREIKIPSTSVYKDMMIIMIVVGSANRSREPKVKFFDKD